MAKWTFAAILFAAILLIGCGGGSGPGDDTNFTSSTNGSTSTSTTSTTSTTGNTTGDVARFQGQFDGAFSGSNTTGARFSGSGYADIDRSGNAYFLFDATVQGAPYSRDFEGTIDATGRFTGVTYTGEPTTGTVRINGDNLQATLTWEKRTVNGNVFYTETETFNLFRT